MIKTSKPTSNFVAKLLFCELTNLFSALVSAKLKIYLQEKLSVTLFFKGLYY